MIGLVKDGDINNTAHLGSCNRTGILPFVACIVKQCNPNGLGDMQICVKVSLLNTNNMYWNQIVQLIHAFTRTGSYWHRLGKRAPESTSSSRIWERSYCWSSFTSEHRKSSLHHTHLIKCYLTWDSIALYPCHTHVL